MHTNYFRYLLRAICALYDGLSPEVATERMFPADDEFVKLKEYLKQYYPTDSISGKLKYANMEGVRSLQFQCASHQFITNVECQGCVHY